MLRSASVLAGFCILALGSACQTKSGPAAGAAPEEKSTRDGVYTLAQASRGEQVFNGVCYRCHSTSEWKHESFLRNWSGRTVDDLFNRLYETMPPRGPLPIHEYADVIAYMMSLNGLPPGDSELTPDASLLRAIRIEPAITRTGASR